MGLPWIVFAAVLALAAPALTTTLAVESRAGQVLVHVTVHNRGRTTLYVPRALVADVHPLDITHSYAFLPGEHHYTLAYAGGAVSRLNMLTVTHALAPAPAHFLHTAL